jgi:hypothetical protein
VNVQRPSLECVRSGATGLREFIQASGHGPPAKPRLITRQSTSFQTLFRRAGVRGPFRSGAFGRSGTVVRSRLRDYSWLGYLADAGFELRTSRASRRLTTLTGSRRWTPAAIPRPGAPVAWSCSSELTPEQFDCQLSVSLIGPMIVTRAVLPVMRKQRAGHIISIFDEGGSSRRGSSRNCSEEVRVGFRSPRVDALVR